MVSLSTQVFRGNLVESKHEAICLVKDSSNQVIYSTNNENDLIYPRSAIKVFQALPFIKSKAHTLLNLNVRSNLSIGFYIRWCILRMYIQVDLISLI